MNCYGICRMLDGSFTLHKLKAANGRMMIETDAKGVKRLVKRDAIIGSGRFAMLEVEAYQEYFTDGGDLTGENRRLLVPAVTYNSTDGKTVYIVPVTVDDVKLPRLPRSMYEPGCGYFNPTFLFEREKKDGAK